MKRQLYSPGVKSYAQWENQESYVANQPFTDFAVPDVHLFEIFAEEPEASELSLSSGMDGLINFGIFKMKQSENQARFIEVFREALVMMSGQAGLISTHARRFYSNGFKPSVLSHFRRNA
jgi:hypothetical protein